MKKILFIAIAAGTLTACNTHTSKIEPTAGSTDTLHMKKAVYQCPMDEDIVSDKPGKCSKCGMDLELKDQK
jgi:hypothetical protein